MGGTAQPRGRRLCHPRGRAWLGHGLDRHRPGSVCVPGAFTAAPAAPRWASPASPASLRGASVPFGEADLVTWRHIACMCASSVSAAGSNNLVRTTQVYAGPRRAAVASSGRVLTTYGGAAPGTPASAPTRPRFTTGILDAQGTVGRLDSLTVYGRAPRRRRGPQLAAYDVGDDDGATRSATPLPRPTSSAPEWSTAQFPGAPRLPAGRRRPLAPVRAPCPTHSTRAPPPPRALPPSASPSTCGTPPTMALHWPPRPSARRLQCMASRWLSFPRTRRRCAPSTRRSRRRRAHRQRHARQLPETSRQRPPPARL